MKSQIMLLVLASGLVMAGCGGNNAKPKDSSKDSSKDTSSVVSSEDSSVTSSQATSEESSEESSEETVNPVLYFRTSGWWHDVGGLGVPYIGIDGNEDYDTMLHMTWLRTAHPEEDLYYDFFTIPLEDLGSATTIQIFRMGPHYENEQPTETFEYWGAKTVAITLADKGSNNMYDIKDTEANWTSPVEGVWGVYDETDLNPVPPGPGPEPVEGTIYFKDEAWWATDVAYTAVYTWGGSGPAFPGTLMTCVSGMPSASGGNVWSSDASILDGVTGFIFVRVSSELADWGAKTVDLSPSDIGSNNLYDITGSQAAWGNPGVSGTWTQYAA